MTTSASLKQMIAKYEQKLTSTEPDTAVHINLASLYLDLANLENAEENIQKSIEFSQLTLQTNHAILDNSSFPNASLKRQNVLTQDNLAQAYYQRAQLTARREDLLIAASQMEAARTACINASDFYLYNKMSCRVSVMYFQLMLGSKTPAQVTKYYEQILDIAKNLRSDDEFSNADIALYLETSAFASLEYWKHIKVDRLLSSAIKPLEKAITFGFSKDSAMTRAKVYHELGQAYARLGQQEKANLAIEQAINNYKQAERYDLVKEAEAVLQINSDFLGRLGDWLKRKCS